MSALGSALSIVHRTGVILLIISCERPWGPYSLPC